MVEQRAVTGNNFSVRERVALWLLEMRMIGIRRINLSDYMNALTSLLSPGGGHSPSDYRNNRASEAKKRIKKS
jgi:hypothetical protein